MKKLFLILLTGLFSLNASAQWVSGGTTQAVTSGNKQIRWNFGANGFVYGYTKGQIDSIKASLPVGGVSSVFGRTGAVTALTSDYDSFYPTFSIFNTTTGTSTQQQIDDDRIALENHESDHTNPHVVTKAQVGLGNVDNTSDILKPVSNATKDSLNAEANRRINADGILAANIAKVRSQTSPTVSATAGLNYVDIPALIGQFPLVIFRSGYLQYTVDSTPSDFLKKVSFDPSNGRITFPAALSVNEIVFATYTSLEGITTTGGNFAYKGSAVTDGTPGTPTNNSFWTAMPGTYTNYGNVTIPSSNFGFISYVGGAWAVTYTPLDLSGYVTTTALNTSLLNYYTKSELINAFTFGPDISTGWFDNREWLSTFNTKGTNSSFSASNNMIAVTAGDVLYIKNINATIISNSSIVGRKWAADGTFIANILKADLTVTAGGYKYEIKNTTGLPAVAWIGVTIRKADGATATTPAEVHKVTSNGDDRLRSELMPTNLANLTLPNVFYTWCNACYNPGRTGYTSAQNKMMVYVKYAPNTNLYAGMSVGRDVSTSSYINYFRLVGGAIYRYENNAMVLITNILTSGENEQAVGQTGKSDATGGYHGDEKIDSLSAVKNTFYANGVALTATDLAADFTLKSADEFSYKEVSSLFDKDNAAHSVIATHYKETDFKDAGYTTKNTIIFNGAYPISNYYSGIVALDFVQSDFAINDDLQQRTLNHSSGNGSTRYLSLTGGHGFTFTSPTNKMGAFITSQFLYDSVTDALAVSWIKDNEAYSKYYRTLDNYTTIAGKKYITLTSVTFKKL
jgi:hypothetical protein